MANKENVGECPPPKKKHILSLSLKHKPLVPQQETRFAEPVSEYEVKLASKGVVPDNTKRNNEWAARNFADWSRARSEKVKDDPVPQDLLNCKDPELLCKWLCIYVMETRQESGKPYPPTSIYGLLCGILRIVRGNGVPFNFLDKSDIRFRDLHQTLDRVCCDLHSKGVGADKKSASVISFEDEDLFWEIGAVGFETPRSLLNLVFYYVGLHFCLRGGQEQRDLSFQQLSHIPPDRDVYDEDTYYEYVSKNNQHRFRDIHSKNKSVKAYAVVTSPRCVVEILDYYYKKVPLEPKAFYLRPLPAVPKDPTKPWFANVPVGVNTLKNIVSKIAEQAGSTIKYTNHSLRATATSRMFVKNVPEKIIAEKTGHRSLAGLHAYERTTLDQERAVTKTLGSVNATFCLPDENYPTESKPKLDPCNKKIFQCLLIKWKTVFSTSIN